MDGLGVLDTGKNGTDLMSTVDEYDAWAKFVGIQRPVRHASEAVVGLSATQSTGSTRGAFESPSPPSGGVGRCTHNCGGVGGYGHFTISLCVVPEAWWCSYRCLQGCGFGLEFNNVGRLDQVVLEFGFHPFLCHPPRRPTNTDRPEDVSRIHQDRCTDGT